MSIVRAMSAVQAAFVLSFTQAGTVQRHCDLVKASATAKVPFLFMMSRAKLVSRGKYDFTKAREAAQAVSEGKADPSAPAVKAKAVKAVKAPKAKAKTVKAKTDTKGKITVPKSTPKITPAVIVTPTDTPTLN